MTIPTRVYFPDEEDYYFEVYLKDLGKKPGYVDWANEWIVVNINYKETDFISRLLEIAAKDAITGSAFKTKLSKKQIEWVGHFLTPLLEKNKEIFN